MKKKKKSKRKVLSASDLKRVRGGFRWGGGRGSSRLGRGSTYGIRGLASAGGDGKTEESLEDNGKSSYKYD